MVCGLVFLGQFCAGDGFQLVDEIEVAERGIPGTVYLFSGLPNSAWNSGGSINLPPLGFSPLYGTKSIESEKKITKPGA
jgi:hypothetical protein